MSEPITSVEAAVRELGALPVPVGSAVKEPRPIAYARKVTEADLLLAHPLEKQRAAEWPWDMWCRICHIRPTSHRTEAEALEAADRHVKLSHAPQDEVHKLMAAGGLAELERLWARVAELEQANAGLDDLRVRALDKNDTLRERIAQLEAERHMTNEALDDAVKALRARGEDAPPYTATPEAHRQMRAALTKHFTSARGGVCENCGSSPEQWCPDCAACEKGCFGGFDGNNCTHSNAKWGGQ